MHTTSYHLPLVWLSLLVAVFASFVALDLVGAVSRATGRAKALWLGGGTFAMGFGIWSMHFIGMLAFEMHSVTMAYDALLMGVSVFVALAASGFALFVMSRPSVSVSAALGAATAMATAIAGMHYIGMYSMRMPVRLEWHWDMVILSIIIAFFSSLGAIVVSIRLRNSRSPGPSIPRRHLDGPWDRGHALHRDGSGDFQARPPS